MATLGSRFKELREKAGKTQREMAEILNHKTTRQVQRIEADESTLDSKQIVMLADYFGVSTDYLLGRTDDPTFNK
ncbi:hypothetical protein PACILC2_34620 [Paenibacillus cisolokensis]|uniref:HTH cro/C1-type domain-containing protein n=1 Tax=Paenibacillus cisolokensis TaxID=1658519 RepID=A0ABQ4NAB3_9BACL|nr:helix-turn-helix transcriptional regulator [Paenibacillus cisolokensis]GIQ64894.1 hypothetical protein PACILC2_34620 [Paenibacillus cisolokensis]